MQGKLDRSRGNVMQHSECYEITATKLMRIAALYSCELIYLEPIALIGHDVVLMRERRINARRRCSTH